MAKWIQSLIKKYAEKEFEAQREYLDRKMDDIVRLADKCVELKNDLEDMDTVQDLKDKVEDLENDFESRKWDFRAAKEDLEEEHEKLTDRVDELESVPEVITHLEFKKEQLRQKMLERHAAAINKKESP